MYMFPYRFERRSNLIQLDFHVLANQAGRPLSRAGNPIEIRISLAASNKKMGP